MTKYNSIFIINKRIKYTLYKCINFCRKIQKARKKQLSKFLNDGCLLDFLQKLILYKILKYVYINLALIYSEQYINVWVYKYFYIMIINYKFKLISMYNTSVRNIYVLLLFLTLQLILYFFYFILV